MHIEQFLKLSQKGKAKSMCKAWLRLHNTQNNKKGVRGHVWWQAEREGGGRWCVQKVRKSGVGQGEGVCGKKGKVKGKKQSSDTHGVVVVVVGECPKRMRQVRPAQVTGHWLHGLGCSFWSAFEVKVVA